MKLSPLFFGSLAFAIPAFSASATTYSGNGATGFGGAVGNGILTVTSNVAAGTITFSEAPSGGSFNGNALVLYIDSQAGGFSDTSTFTDNNDGERRAVSGYYLNNPYSTPAGTTTQTVTTFPTGFTADHAIAFDNNNANAYTLSTGTFPFILNAAQSASPYSITLTLGSLGVTTGSLSFVGTFLSETAYRSNEAIGTLSTATSSASGFTAPITFTSTNYFAIPEPGSMAAVGLGVVALAGFAVRRKQRSA